MGSGALGLVWTTANSKLLLGTKVVPPPSTFLFCFSKANQYKQQISIIIFKNVQMLYYLFLLFAFIIIVLMSKQLQKIYEQLRLYYQLIYIYDLQPYSINDLKSLALRLQGQLQLDEREKKIHERIIQKSKDNVEKKLKEKKSKASQSLVIKSQVKKQGKKQIKAESKSQIKAESKSQIKAESQSFLSFYKNKDEEDEACYIQESCIIDSLEKDNYQNVRTIEGQIYDGRLMVRLPTHTKNIQKQIFYELCPQLTQSFLNKETYKQFSQIQNPSKLNLRIYGKEVEFKVSNGQNNSLGLNYLRGNNILIKSNFRTENSAFSMIFTQ